MLILLKLQVEGREPLEHSLSLQFPVLPKIDARRERGVLRDTAVRPGIDTVVVVILVPLARIQTGDRDVVLGIDPPEAVGLVLALGPDLEPGEEADLGPIPIDGTGLDPGDREDLDPVNVGEIEDQDL